jgi:hypothetical protein
MKVPGKAPVSIVRTVEMKNGKGRKTLKVLRGSKTISSVSESLTPVEKHKIQKRKFVKGIHKRNERKTRRNLF